jgi:hypothetical protein
MNDLLVISLQATVPLWIERVKHLTDTGRQARAAELSGVIGSRGDDILFRAEKKGETASAFNALAEGLAIAACQPGGVTAFGQHWCADHAVCLAAEREAS